MARKKENKVGGEGLWRRGGESRGGESRVI